MYMVLERVYKLFPCTLATLREPGRSYYEHRWCGHKRFRQGWRGAGVVAPITYLDNADCEVPNILANEENIFRPYFLKSVAYEYEKEIRFVLAARHEIVRD
jgi:hypothetical protein